MAIYRINDYIQDAIKVIEDCKISDKNNTVDKNFRAHISSFGASVQMGSLVAAVAFYSRQRSKKADTEKLMDAINRIVYKESCDKTLLRNVIADNGARKEEILDAAVAIKLALNAYILEKPGQNKPDKQEAIENAGDK